MFLFLKFIKVLARYRVRQKTKPIIRIIIHLFGHNNSFSKQCKLFFYKDIIINEFIISFYTSDQKMEFSFVSGLSSVKKNVANQKNSPVTVYMDTRSWTRVNRGRQIYAILMKQFNETSYNFEDSDILTSQQICNSQFTTAIYILLIKRV